MENKITKQRIIDAIENYTQDHLDNRKRQSRIKAMVEKHGVELTALACGLFQSTLTQYMRLKTAPSINENSVLKGERIFKELSASK